MSGRSGADTMPPDDRGDVVSSRSGLATGPRGAADDATTGTARVHGRTGVEGDPSAHQQLGRSLAGRVVAPLLGVMCLVWLIGCSTTEESSDHDPDAVVTTTTLDLRVIKAVSAEEAEWRDSLDEVCGTWTPLGTDITTLDQAFAFIKADGDQLAANVAQIAESDPPPVATPESDAFVAHVEVLQTAIDRASQAAVDDDRAAFAEAYDQLIAANIATDIDGIRMGLDVCAPEQPSINVEPDVLIDRGWAWSYLDRTFAAPGTDDALMRCFHDQMQRKQSFDELLDATLRHATHSAVVTLPALTQEAQRTCLDAESA
ncbi:MAG: hypothetical protein KDB86_07975 [Actinobacteria bacterium]|nr:hypothetical protein [Actinomycetota bacterium]